MAKLIPFLPIAVVLAFLVLLVLFWGGRCSGRVIGRWNRRRRAERKAARDRVIPWTPFTRLNPQTCVHHIGVERVTPEGLVLNRVEMSRVPMSDVMAKLEAEGDALVRAAAYNEAKAGM